MSVPHNGGVGVGIGVTARRAPASNPGTERSGGTHGVRDCPLAHTLGRGC
jgi:hypothetical protein